jgi:hypothetical protein
MQQRVHARRAAAGREPHEHTLELGHLACDDVEQRVGLARHPVGGDHLGHRADRAGEAPMGDVVVALEGHRDVDLQREAGRGRIHARDDAAHDPRLLEPPDPVQGGRGRQPHEARELDVRAIRVDLQLLEQARSTKSSERALVRIIVRLERTSSSHRAAFAYVAP